MSLSDKNKTNRKWISNDKYKDNYDNIFSKSIVLSDRDFDTLEDIEDDEPNQELKDLMSDKVKESV